MASNNADLVQAFFAALDSGDGTGFLSNDFEFHGAAVPEPLDKQAYLGLVSLFQTAFPDLKRIVHAIHGEGDVVKVTIQGVGTHTGPLDLSLMGLAPIPATGKAITLPRGQWELTVVDDKITVLRDVTPPSPDSGVPGMLKALGVALPTQ